MQKKKKQIESILTNMLISAAGILDITEGEASVEFYKRYVKICDDIEALLEEVKNNQIRVFGKEQLGKVKDNFKII